MVLGSEIGNLPKLDKLKQFKWFIRLVRLNLLDNQ